MKRIVVIGGGIAGLAAAYRLGVESQKRGIPLEALLLEGGPSVGGTIATERREGFLLEQGPDCFLSSKPAGIALCRELGIEDRLIGTNPEHRRSFIVRAGRLVPVPEGFYLLAPSSLRSVWRAPLFSWRGRLRMALEPLVPARRDGEDETLERFVVRRLGREALERLAQPMVAGIYTADPAHLSLQATMPQFLQLEREHGSVIRGLGRSRNLQAQSASGPRYGLFATFHGGMRELTDALAARLPEGTVRTGARAARLEKTGSAGAPWRVTLDGGETLEAHAVCLALPAPSAAHLLSEAAPALSAELAAIPYASTATGNVALRREQVGHPLDGMGFVVPAIEKRYALSCSFSSVKFAGRAPAGQVLLRAFVGGALQPEHLDRPDEQIARAVLDDLSPLLGISGEPLFTQVRRHPVSMPQYLLGHPRRVEVIEKHTAAIPGLALAGNAYRGVGIPDCVASAERACGSLLDALQVKG